MFKTAQEKWDAVKTNGCSASPDLWMKEACNRHDRHYGTHAHRDGTEITRAQADWEFLKDARKTAPDFITRNTIPFLYYIMVRIFGGSHW